MVLSTRPRPYRLCLRDQQFDLSTSQVELVDVPNRLFDSFATIKKPEFGSTKWIYGDRRPEYFPPIYDYLAGYRSDRLFPVHFPGLTAQESAAALLEEARYFQLKGLIRLVQEHLDTYDTAPLPSFRWPVPSAPEVQQTFRPAKNLKDFAATVEASGAGQKELYSLLKGPAAIQPDESVDFWSFRNVVLRIDFRQHKANDLPVVGVIFVNPAERAAVSCMCPAHSDVVPVNTLSTRRLQGTAVVDEAAIALHSLLRWPGKRRFEPAAEVHSTLSGHNQYFNPQLLAAEDCVLDLRVRSAIGFWEDGKLALAQVVVRLSDQGVQTWA
ncbi:hypothetical protein Rhopal_006463-T1 [Rhodotorula paludigena]|uniref:Potassium channel tetramerisation-type BTB domain-containing protein n=1 Tax=Rhodotorula paludigena TaxID=86838 RepID=A0AAV5GT52_9BASI|nr:hypothetical protein Rhopal_006463-T1 [Rhodotorula paludigena]